VAIYEIVVSLHYDYILLGLNISSGAEVLFDERPKINKKELFDREKEVEEMLLNLNSLFSYNGYKENRKDFSHECCTE
jgi:hypothetical protein